MYKESWLFSFSLYIIMEKKNAWQCLWFFFSFFSLKIKYGWAIRNILTCRIEKGKLIQTDTFFENLYDFWIPYHNPAKIIYYWYCPKILKIENTIRRKWNSKDLPKVNIIFKKYIEKDDFFNPQKFLEEDQEMYFELLKTWKIDFEDSYLNEHPHLCFDPVRHKKCLMSKQRPCLRYIF